MASLLLAFLAKKTKFKKIPCQEMGGFPAIKHQPRCQILGPLPFGLFLAQLLPGNWQKQAISPECPLANPNLLVLQSLWLCYYEYLAKSK
jgi:hypothetical protein